MDKLVLQAVEEVALEGPEGKRGPGLFAKPICRRISATCRRAGCTTGQLWQLLESRLPAEVSELTHTLKTLLLSEISKRSDVVVKACSAAASIQ